MLPPLFATIFTSFTEYTEDAAIAMVLVGSATLVLPISSTSNVILFSAGFVPLGKFIRAGLTISAVVVPLLIGTPLLLGDFIKVYHPAEPHLHTLYGLPEKAEPENAPRTGRYRHTGRYRGNLPPCPGTPRLRRRRQSPRQRKFRRFPRPRSRHTEARLQAGFFRMRLQNSLLSGLVVLQFEELGEFVGGQIFVKGHVFSLGIFEYAVGHCAAPCSAVQLGVGPWNTSVTGSVYAHLCPLL